MRFPQNLPCLFGTGVQESDDEQIEEVFIEDTPVIKVVAHKEIISLRNKGPIPNTLPQFKDQIPLRKITPPPAPPKPNDTSQGKINNKTRKSSPTNIDKPSTSAFRLEIMPSLTWYQTTTKPVSRNLNKQ
jgi:hypothetical protein